MKKSTLKRIFILLIVLVALYFIAIFALSKFVGYMSAGITDISKNSFQISADTQRLQHTEYYGALINEYHEKTGNYPLQGEHERSNYVFIVNEYQKKYLASEPDPSNYETDLSEFISTLEEGLEKKIEIKYDPQKVKTTFPNYYTYMVKGDTYYFEVNLSGDYSFAKKMRAGFSRMEITSDSKADIKGKGNWYFSELIEDPEFIRVTNLKDSVNKE